MGLCDNPIGQVAPVTDTGYPHVFRIDNIIPADGIIHAGHNIPEITTRQITYHGIRKSLSLIGTSPGVDDKYAIAIGGKLLQTVVNTIAVLSMRATMDV